MILPKYLLMVLALSVLPAALDAATPYEDEVPIELARYFLPGNWYSDLPPDLPSFAIPDGLTLVGSQDQIQRKQVLFRSAGMAAEAAQEALAEALLREAGWVRMGDANRVTRFGFVAASGEAPLPAVQLCRDNLGLLTIAGRASGFVHMNFFATVTSNSQSCAQRSQMLARAVGNRQTYLEYTPLLELPDNITPTIPQRIRDALSGEAFAYDTDALITADTSLRRLANSFARQMRRQGWRRNETWRGDITAGNSWTRELDDGTRLAASIDIVRTDDDDYSLKLQMMEVLQEE